MKRVFKSLLGRKTAHTSAPSPSPSPSPSPTPSPSPGNSQTPRSSFSQRFVPSVYCQTLGGYPGQSNPYHHPPPTECSQWSTNQSPATDDGPDHQHQHQHQPYFDHCEPRRSSFQLAPPEYYQPSPVDHQPHQPYHLPDHQHHQLPYHQPYVQSSLPGPYSYNQFSNFAGSSSYNQFSNYGTSTGGNSSPVDDPRPYYVSDGSVSDKDRVAKMVYGGKGVLVDINWKYDEDTYGTVEYMFTTVATKGRISNDLKKNLQKEFSKLFKTCKYNAFKVVNFSDFPEDLSEDTTILKMYDMLVKKDRIQIEVRRY